MKLPISWLSEFISFPKGLTIDQISEAFIKVGFEVEGIENPASNIKGPIKVGTVLSVKELTEHKKPIRYVGLDVGEKSARYVICGATNFKVGDKVVVALPGAVLPGNFEISARQTYGHLSNGMICSSRELGLGEDHSGIIVLDTESSKSIKPGSNALSALGADDPIIDIAVNPDRGYAMSVRGAARELAMALNLKFKDIDSKSLYAKIQKRRKPGKLTQVSILDKKAADLIYIRSLSNFESSAKTPPWMARRLIQSGMRPISLAVDITNYVMLEIGQPLHAFDADRIADKLQVQRAGKFKTLVTLDGQTRKLNPEDILIADTKQPLALGGTMGGQISEVSETTNRLAIEAAHFLPGGVARQSRKHQLSTEASRRFERGVDPRLAELASARAVELLVELSGAIYHGFTSQGSLPSPQSLQIDPTRISELIGSKYSTAELARALTSVGCVIKRSTKTWKVTSPSWRTDLSHLSDLAEEVARFFGYDRIPERLPQVAAQPETGISYLSARRRSLSKMLAATGFVEVQNFPFVNQREMDLFAFSGDRARAFRIANPISEEYPLLRTHLSPGLLKAASRNLARGEKSVSLFETGLIYRDIRNLPVRKKVSTANRPTKAEISEIYGSVPFQSLHLAGVIAGEIEQSGWWGSGRTATWEDAVEITESLLRELVSDFEIVTADLSPWHPGRCAEFRVDGKPVAHAGEVHPRITSELNLPTRTCYFGIVLDAIAQRDRVLAPPVNTLPATIQDISMFVSETVPAAAVARALKAGAGELLESVSLFDRFTKAGESEVSLAFTLTFRAKDRTLTNEEVSALRERAGARAVKDCGVRIRA